MRMKRNKTQGVHDQLRRRLVQEAARLMYEEGVSQYLDAKQLAAKRLLSQGQGKRPRYRPQELPSNGEIADELRLLAQFHEGDRNRQQLFEMRLVALDLMEVLAEFRPRLIGSVSTGRVRRSSDIDLQLFCDRIEAVEAQLYGLDWPFDTKQVCVQHSGRMTEYRHIYLHREYPVELSIYPLNEIRVRRRSSTDGRPIVRLSRERLLERLFAEHAEAWHEHTAGSSAEGVTRV